MLSSKDWVKPALFYSFITIFFFLFLTLSGQKVDSYYVFLVTFFAYVFHMESKSFYLFRKGERELVSFINFLSDIRHHYYVHRMVDEAVSETMEQCKESGMRKKAEEILDVLTSDHVQEAEEQYKDKEKNRFLRLFLTLCIVVIEFGDKEVEGRSLFLQNIKNLKEELQGELLQLRAVRHRFSGLTLVVVIPVFTLKLIESWGIGNLPELEKFYYGNSGTIFKVVLYVLSFFVYDMLLELKSSILKVKQEEKIIFFIAELPRIKRFLWNYEKQHPVHMFRWKELQSETGNSLTCPEFLLKRVLFGGLTFVFTLLVSLFVIDGDYPFYVLLLLFFLSYLSYYFPVFRLYFQRKISRMQMEDEVLQYQCIILMLMYVDQMSVFHLLEEIESFSNIFKRHLRDCINDYHAGDREALLRLREKGGCESFEHLVDNMLVCDEIGLQKAFDEIVLERNHIRERRKQENEYSLDKKVLLGKVFGFIPMLLTIGGYLILPFVYESYQMLSEFSFQLN